MVKRVVALSYDKKKEMNKKDEINQVKHMKIK